MINRYFTSELRRANSFIALPDWKNPRVLLPADNKELFRQGFEVHNTSSVKNKILKTVSIQLFPLVRFLKRKRFYTLPGTNELLKKMAPVLADDKPENISVYIGTPDSKNRKLTFQLMNSSNGIIGYAKIANQPDSKKYLHNESNICRFLSAIPFEKIIVPEIISEIESNNSLVVVENNIFINPSQLGCDLSEDLIAAYSELYLKTKKDHAKNNYFIRIKNLIIMNDLPQTVKDPLSNSICNLEKIHFSTMLQHGDFVPYNIKRQKDKYAVIDWEFAREEGQPFYDLFHFIYQGKYRIQKKSHIKLIREILQDSVNHSLLTGYFENIGVQKGCMRDFFILYLLEALENERMQRTNFVLEESHFYKGLTYLQSK